MTRGGHSVLAAVDFGDASAQAIAIAGAIAGGCGGSTLQVLHAEATDAPAYFTADQIGSLERQRQASDRQAAEFLARFARRHTTTPFATVIDHRPPVDAILRASEAADLVVIGTHGRRGPKHWWLGSVAERVLRDIGRPLLIARAPGPVSATSVFRRVLVGAASPLTGADALRLGRNLAACFDGEVADRRDGRIDSAAADGATLIVAAAPDPRTPSWFALEGERLVRGCTLPILFVPEAQPGVTP